MSQTISARLDRMPITGLHRRLAAAVGAGLLVDGFDVYLAAGVAGALVKQEGASLRFVGLMTASGVLGLAIGGLLAGFLADRFGRRRTLQATMTVVLIGSIAAALAPSLSLLLVFRTLATIGLGGEPVLGYATLGEFLPPARRGRWLAWMGLCGNIGMPLALFLGILILPHPGGWRWMLALPALAAIPVLWLRRGFPESPRWLVTRDRHEEADAIVRSIEQSAVGTVLLPVVAPPATSTVSALSGREIARRMIVACAINVGIISAVFGFVSWLPTFFVTEGRTVASSVGFAGLMSLGIPTGVLLALVVIEHVERKWSYVGASVATLALGAGYALATSDTTILVFGFLVVTTLFFAGTIGITAYVPEMLPTAMRMRGIGGAAAIGRAVAMLLPIPIVWLLELGGQRAVILLILAIVALQTLVVAALGIRSNGRSLDGI